MSQPCQATRMTGHPGGGHSRHRAADRRVADTCHRRPRIPRTQCTVRTAPQRLHLRPEARRHRCDRARPATTRRRRAVIGHVKAEHRMGRNYLAGGAGEAANAILAAVEYNFRRLLAWLAAQSNAGHHVAKAKLRCLRSSVYHAVAWERGPPHRHQCRRVDIDKPRQPSTADHA